MLTLQLFSLHRFFLNYYYLKRKVYSMKSSYGNYKNGQTVFCHLITCNEITLSGK